MDNLDQYILGETSELIEFDGSTDNREIASTMAQQAVRSIRMLTPDLEPPLYDQEFYSDP